MQKGRELMYQTATEELKEQKINEKPSFKLAKVTSLFDDGCPSIQFYGESAPSQKKYKVIDGTMYAVGDSVLVATIENSYIILGAVNYDAGQSDSEGYLTQEQANLLFATINHAHSGYASSSHRHDRLLTSYDNGVYLTTVAGDSNVNTDFSPTNTSTVCGKQKKWYQIYARTSTIETSDRNMKHDIETIPEKYIEFYKQLTPRRFKLNQSTYKRYHTGFISQEVEEALENSGVDSTEFAGFVKTEEGESTEYGLRYEEFIALNTMMIQGLLKENEELKKRIDEIESKFVEGEQNG